jgi:hypothetical protein
MDSVSGVRENNVTPYSLSLDVQPFLARVVL